MSEETALRLARCLQTGALRSGEEIAAELAGKAGPALGVIKGRLYAEPIRLLTTSEGTAPPR